jgi:hypothetical protein
MSPDWWIYTMIVALLVLGWTETRWVAAAEQQAAALAEKDMEIAAWQTIAQDAAAEIERLYVELTGKDAQIAHALGQMQMGADEINRLHDEIEHRKHASESSPVVDFRYRRLRSLILKELHPDHAPPGSADQALRQEMFKALWPKIEALDAKEAA